jgi:hypothetical protein
MSTVSIDVNLPAISATEVLEVFPTLDGAGSPTLTNSEGTLELTQSASDWSDIIQVKVDSGDVLDVADGDDVQYKINGDWPAYVGGATFLTATFASTDEHETQGGTTTKAVLGNVVNAAMKGNISEDYVGNINSFDLFSNEGALSGDIDTQTAELEDKVEDLWNNTASDTPAGLQGVEHNNGTAFAESPARTIALAVLNAKASGSDGAHPGIALLATNLTARSAATDYANLPLAAGDKLSFNITYTNANADSSSAIPLGGLHSTHSPKAHIFKVTVTLV